MASAAITGSVVDGYFQCSSGSTWYQLSSVSTPCTRVEISPGLNNSGNILFVTRGAYTANPSPSPGSPTVVSTTSQPSNTLTARVLPNTATGINPLVVSDLSWIWVYAVNAGDIVVYNVLH